jgi:hypothetical protein
VRLLVAGRQVAVDMLQLARETGRVDAPGQIVDGMTQLVRDDAGRLVRPQAAREADLADAVAGIVVTRPVSAYGSSRELRRCDGLGGSVESSRAFFGLSWSNRFVDAASASASRPRMVHRARRPRALRKSARVIASSSAWEVVIETPLHYCPWI